MTKDVFRTPERMMIADFVNEHILTLEDDNDFLALVLAMLQRRAEMSKKKASQYIDLLNWINCITEGDISC
ncbi:MAG: hypothetical protein IKO45_04975 [Clostridia bacterium]|nr:hypothetical protein [Clostridia bacterium]MBR4623887.1 hypothetical protein [Clostridia bacterium]